MKLLSKTSALLLFSFCLAGAAKAQVQPAAYPMMPPLVSVEGKGEVKVQPDEIVLNLGVETRDRTLETAREQTDKKVAAILTVLKKAGVDAKHVQTTYMSVQPIYSGENYGQSTPDSYMAQKSMTVTIRNISKFDEIMAGVYKAGGNRVDGIHYRSTKLEQHREEARKLAVQAARRKADSLTKELGTKVGRVYNITESSSEGYPRPMQNMYKGMMMEARTGGGEETTISPGEITITAHVQVSFTLD